MKKSKFIYIWNRNFWTALYYFVSLRLSSYGRFVGVRLIDLIVLREKGYKRETKLLSMLMFIKSTVWKSLFGKEAEKLERSNDDPCKCRITVKIFFIILIVSDFIIEKDPIVNTYISLPKDKGSLNCASFNAGIIEAFLTVLIYFIFLRCYFYYVFWKFSINVWVIGNANKHILWTCWVKTKH